MYQRDADDRYEGDGLLDCRLVHDEVADIAVSSYGGMVPSRRQSRFWMKIGVKMTVFDGKNQGECQ